VNGERREAGGGRPERAGGPGGLLGPPGRIATPRLSICIATRNRAGFIAETLDSIVPQLGPAVELVIVDGASTDATPGILRDYQSRTPALRVVHEPVNSGVDGDYDRAVGYARGEHCWLMTDDDVLVPGAVARVLAALKDGPDLLVVNAEVRTVDLAEVLVPWRLGFGDDRRYGTGPEEEARLFAEVADGLSFIGCVVVRRALWLARDRARYDGTLFGHVGVIFQAPVGPARALGAPAIVIRYGNAGWTARTFEIWMLKWPRLIWSFDHFPAAARARVTAPEPWRALRWLLVYRASGAYGLPEFRRFIPSSAPALARLLPWLVAATPAGLANAAGSLYCALWNRRARGTMYDLARSPHASFVTRWAARVVGVARGGAAR
jgi:abequosyltransferase